MHDAGATHGEEANILGDDVIGVDGQQAIVDQAKAGQVLDRGLTAAIAVVACISREPVMERPTRRGEHLEFV